MSACWCVPPWNQPRHTLWRCPDCHTLWHADPTPTGVTWTYATIRQRATTRLRGHA